MNGSDGLVSSTTITYSDATGNLPEGSIILRNPDYLGCWHFHRISSVDSATCMTVEDLPLPLLWKMRIPYVWAVAWRCMLAISFGSFMGFVLGLA